MRAHRFDSLFARLLLVQVVIGFGYVLLFGAFFYVERNVTVARLVAERWAPMLLAEAGLPAAAQARPVVDEVLRQSERPAHAITAPAIGPRMAALERALRERGVPLEAMAATLGRDGPQLWLAVQSAPSRETIWLGLPGDEVLPNVPGRLLLALAFGSALLVGVSWWFTRRLTRPLQQLRERMLAHQPQREPAAAAAPIEMAATPEIAAIDLAWRELLDRYGQHESERALLLAGVSHDLRAPLARIHIAAELLPDEGPHAARREAIVRNTRVADRLLGSFLDHVRAGELPMNECCDLAALAREVAARLEAPPSQLSVEAPPQLVLDGVSATLLERLVANLLDNAFAHGRPPVQLRVAELGPGAARIEVADAGPGIDDARQAEALKAFARGDPARGAPGLGLGLAIVARIARRLGGSVSFGREAGMFVVRVDLELVAWRT